MRAALIGMALGFAAIAHAEDPAAAQWDELVAAEAGMLDVPPALPAPAPELVDDLTYQIGSQLRCPVCQGLSIADSPSETAVTMKHRVKELVAAGYSEGQIREYFIARYGEWVLLAPPSNGLGRLLWWSPALGLLAAAGVVGWRLRSRPVPAASPGDAAPGEADPYRKRLLAEVEAE